MTAVSDNGQLCADGGLEPDLGRVPRDDHRRDIHAVRTHGPLLFPVDGLLCLGAPVYVGGHRVHADTVGYCPAFTAWTPSPVRATWPTADLRESSELGEPSTQTTMCPGVLMMSFLPSVRDLMGTLTTS